MGIKSWPVSEHPRQRLLRQGPAALSDAELLALLLGGGSAGTLALERARSALRRFGAVGTLLAARREVKREKVAERRVETEADIVEGDVPLFI